MARIVVEALLSDRLPDLDRHMMKTNAVPLIDEMDIKYELRESEVDPDDLTAETVANKIGLPLE